MELFSKKVTLFLLFGLLPVIYAQDAENSLEQTWSSQLQAQEADKVKTAKETLIKQLTKAIAEKDNILVSRIIKVLVQFRVNEAVPSLLEILNNDDHVLRKKSADALAVLADTKIAAKFLPVLKQEAVTEVKTAIFGALAKLEAPAVISEALEMLPDDLQGEDAPFLKAIADCAMVLANRYGCEILADIGSGASAVEVRKYALKKLLAIIPTEDMELLGDFLMDTSGEIRRDAFAKLQQTTGLSWGYKPDAPIVDRLVAVAMWRKWWLLPSLYPQLNTEDEQQFQQLLNRFLQLDRQGKIVPLGLSKHYKNASVTAQKNIIKLLGNWNTEVAISHLEKILQQPLLMPIAFNSLLKIYRQQKSERVRKLLLGTWRETSQPQKTQWAIQLVSFTGEKEFAEIVAYLQKLGAKPDTAFLHLLQKYRICHPALLSVWRKKLQSPTEEHLQIIALLLKMKQQQAWAFLGDHFHLLSDEQQLKLIEQVNTGKDIVTIENIASNIELSTENVQIAICRTIATHKVKNACKYLQNLLALQPPWINVQVSLPLQQASITALKSNDALDVAMLFECFFAQQFPQQIAVLKTLRLLKSLDFFYYSSDWHPPLPGFDVYEQLRTIIYSDFATPLRIEAVAILAKCIRKQDMPIVRKVIASVDTPAVKVAALRLVDGFNSETQLTIFKEQLLPEQDIEVKRAILEKLTRLKPVPATYLEKLAAKAKTPQWKESLRDALLRIASPKGIEMLTEAAKQTQPDVKAYALLVKKAPKRAADMLLEIYKKIQEEQQQAKFLRSSSSLLTVQDIPWLFEIVESAKPSGRHVICTILQQLTGENANYSEKSNLDQQKQAIATWKQWHKRTKELNALVDNLIRSKVGDSRTQIQKQILAYGEHAIAVLSKALADANSIMIQQLLVDTLVMTNNRQAIPPLRSLLNQSFPPSFYISLYRGLEKLGDAKFVQDLPLTYLRETDRLVRIHLLDLMLKRKMLMHKSDWQYYLQTAEEDLALLLDMAKRYQFDNEKQLLFELLDKTPQDSHSQILACLDKQLQFHDMPVVINLLSKQNEKDSKVLLAMLQQIPEIPQQSLASQKACLQWWKEQQANIEERFAMQRVLANFVADDTTKVRLAEKQLASLDQEKRKYVQKTLRKWFAEEKRPREQKQRILRLLLDYSQQDGELITETLNSPHPSLRALAAAGLFRLGYSTARATIHQAFEHEDPTVRFYAIKTMGHSGDSQLMPYFIKGIDDGDARVREEALYWAIQFGFQDISHLAALIDDPNPTVRKQAIDRYAQLDVNENLGKIIKRLQDPFLNVRASAYQALKHISKQNFAYDPEEQDASKRKQSYLQWEQWWQLEQKTNDIVALGKKFAEEGIDADEVRNRLLQTYNTVADKTKAQQAIRQLLANPIGIIRLQITRFIASIEDMNFNILLAQMLKDPDIRVRQASLEILHKRAPQKLPFSIEQDLQKKWQKRYDKLKPWWQEQQQSQNLNQLREKLQTLLAQLEKNSEDAALRQEIAATLPRSLNLLNRNLQTASPKLAAIIAQILCQERAMDSIPHIIELLVHKEIRKSVYDSLTSLEMEIPLQDIDQVEREAYLAKLQSWWQTTKARNRSQLEETIVKAIQEVVAKPTQATTTARRLAELGQHARPVLEEYLADRRPIARNTLVLALGYINNWRSVNALLPYLEDSQGVARYVIFEGIGTLAQTPIKKRPQTEEDWETAIAELKNWIEDYQRQKSQQLTQRWQQHRQNLADEELREECISQVIAEGYENGPFALELITAKNLPLTLVALRIIKGIKFIPAAETVLPFTMHGEEKVRQLARQTMAVLGDVKLEELPKITEQDAVWEDEVSRLKNWWQQKGHTLRGVLDEQKLRDVLYAIVDNKLEEDEARKMLTRFGLGVSKAVAKHLRSKNDKLRLGSVRAIALLGFTSDSAALLKGVLDYHTGVRHQTTTTLAALAGEKLPIDIDISEEPKWQRQIDEWLPTWRKEQQQKQLQLELQTLEQVAQPIAEITTLQTKEQVSVLRQVSNYLKSSHLEVQKKALAKLKKIAGDAVYYRLERVPEDETVQEFQQGQQDDYKEIEAWLEAEKTRIQEEEANLRDKMDALDREWAEEGESIAITSIEQCEKLMDLVDEMLEEANSHPLLQKKYLAILKQYGLEPVEYNIYAEQNKREDLLYQLQEKIDTIQQQLATQKENK